MTPRDEANKLMDEAREKMEAVRSLIDAASDLLTTVDPDLSAMLRELEGDMGDIIHTIPGF